MKTVIVNVNLEYCFDVATDEEAEQQAQEVELPGAYVCDSYEFVTVLDGNQTVSQKITEIEAKPLIEICNECGRSVEQGSGRFVNRVLDLNSETDRKTMGRPFPKGDFTCPECEAKIGRD